ncbi:hypothetical protein GY45DRAFT_943210 [Cubamyces sp. BRFM 1775]|nr:hypothetical protein GY45DRAFT_943210 [Cubamyces sp. BRFM 1775]
MAHGTDGRAVVVVERTCTTATSTTTTIQHRMRGEERGERAVPARLVQHNRTVRSARVARSNSNSSSAARGRRLIPKKPQEARSRKNGKEERKKRGRG